MGENWAQFSRTTLGWHLPGHLSFSSVRTLSRSQSLVESGDTRTQLFVRNLFVLKFLSSEILLLVVVGVAVRMGSRFSSDEKGATSVSSSEEQRSTITIFWVDWSRLLCLLVDRLEFSSIGVITAKSFQLSERNRLPVIEFALVSPTIAHSAFSPASTSNFRRPDCLSFDDKLERFVRRHFGKNFGPGRDLTREAIPPTGHLYFDGSRRNSAIRASLRRSTET